MNISSGRIYFFASLFLVYFFSSAISQNQQLTDEVKFTIIQEMYQSYKSESFPNTPDISVDDYLYLMKKEKVILVDVRSPEEWEISMIPEAITKDTFMKNIQRYGEYKGSFLIADLSGYTALTEAHGDFSAAKIISRYNELVQRVLTKDVKLYQQVGDEILLMSSDPRSLLHYAIKLRDKIDKESHFPSIHAGLHYGVVVKQNEKIFGAAINLTSRIASYAQGGQILCSRSFKKSVRKSDISFHSLGERRFKNVMKPVEIYEIKTNIETEEIWYTDPVCRMHISEKSAPAKLPFENKTIYFCSFECAKKFIINPELYKESDHE